MSYSGEPANFAYIIELGIIIANRAHVAVAALFVYDTLLTFSQEVSHIWGRQFSGTTVLYLVNRYGELAQKVLIILGLFPWQSITVRRLSLTSLSVFLYTCLTPSGRYSCTVISWMNDILSAITFLSISMFFALRVYAIMDRQVTLAVTVFVLASLLPAISLYQQSTISLSIVHAPVLGFGICQEHSTIFVGTYSILATTCRVATAASDLLVLVITLVKTFNMRRLASEHNIRTPLMTLLLRDGSLYFAAIFTLNVADVILLQLVTFGAVADIVTTLSVILISRFMLNLRDLSLADSEASRSSRAEFSSVRFTNVLVGTLGAPLVHGEPEAGLVDEDPQLKEEKPAQREELPEFVQGSSSG